MSGNLGSFLLFGRFFPGGGETRIPPFCRDFLAVVAAFLALTLQVSVMTFFFGPLSFILPYLYTWYYLLYFFRLKIEKSVTTGSVYSRRCYTF